MQNVGQRSGDAWLTGEGSVLTSTAGNTALWAGLVFAALIILAFYYRNYVQDGGKFPPGALDDLGLTDGELGVRKAGMLPCLALAAGAALVLWANWFFVLPS